MNVLNAAAIFALANDFNKVAIDLPSGTDFVREMSARQKEKYEAFLTENVGSDCGLLRASLIVATVCDADGVLQFEPSQLNLIADLPSSVVTPLFDAALKLNGMAKGAVDDAKKN